jgi:tetraacyldisaccharide 4'-kinase
LQAAGVVLAATRRFRDHHAYTDADVQGLLRLRKQHAGASFVTTEKDAINLGPRLSSLEPVQLVFVRMELENAEAAVDSILQTVAERRRQPS